MRNWLVDDGKERIMTYGHHGLLEEAAVEGLGAALWVWGKRE